MRKLFPLFLFLICSWRSCSASPDTWAVYLPERVTDERGANLLWQEFKAKPGYGIWFGRTHLVRPGETTGQPLPAPLGRKRYPNARSVLASPTMGLIAVEADTEMVELDYDVSRSIITPMIAVMDSTGSMRELFLNARDPDWSQDGTKLAFRIVRIPIMKQPRRSIVYPEIADSVSIWYAITGARKSFPATSDVLGWEQEWEHGGFISLSHAGQGYALELHDEDTVRCTPFYFAVEVRAGKWSPDARYSLVQGSGRAFAVWSQDAHRDLAAEILKLVGGRDPTIQGAFWVNDGPKGHSLCLGVLRPGRIKDGKQEDGSCEAFVFDLKTMKVLHQYVGGYIAPSADRRYLVLLRRGKMDFVDLASN